MSTALAKIEPQGIAGWESKIDLIKQTVAKGATDTELQLFLYQAKKTGLDPLAKQIYCVKRWNNKTSTAEMAIQTGIDGYRLIADRTGQYAGNDDYEFDDPLKQPLWAKATVYKMVGGQRCPFSATARWEQYWPGEKQGFMWKKMPHVMLGKCAEALALRKAFPAELSGVYTADEMDQAGEPELVNNAPKAPHVAHHQEGQADEVVEGVVEEIKSTDKGTFYKIAEKVCFTEDATIISKLAGAHGLKVELLTHEFKAKDKTFQKINNVIGIEVEPEDLTPLLAASIQQVEERKANPPEPDPYFAEMDGKLRVSGTATEVWEKGKTLFVKMGDVVLSCFVTRSMAIPLRTAKGQRVILDYALTTDGKYKNITDLKRIGDREYFEGKPMQTEAEMFS